MTKGENDGVSLKEYLDKRIDGVEKNTAVAAAAMEKRLEGMNEFRQALSDQKGTFVTRPEINAIVSKLDADIEALKISRAVLEGKATQSSFYLALFFSVVGLVSGIIGLIR